MKTTFNIESFSLAEAAVYIPAAGNASLLPGHAIKAHMRGQHLGHVLRVFQISTSEDLHSDSWDYLAGDEILFMLTGALGD